MTAPPTPSAGSVLIRPPYLFLDASGIHLSDETPQQGDGDRSLYRLQSRNVRSAIWVEYHSVHVGYKPPDLKWK